MPPRERAEFVSPLPRRPQEADPDFVDAHCVGYLATPEEKREFIETALLESMGGFGYLREAMRPKEARGSLDSKAREALDRHERECRNELERLHRPLRKRLEGPHQVPRWHTLSRTEKIAVCGIGVSAILGVGAIATAIAVG